MKKYIKNKSRGTPENHGPGLYNPTRSVRFEDKKKKRNKFWARNKDSED